MTRLRYYQQEAIDALYNYFSEHDGNPIVATPTGSGKSVILAGFIHRAIQQYPGTRIMVLTHVRELIAQDARAIFNYWPDAPLGIYSAGLGKKSRDQITVAGIQSVHQDPGYFSPVDLVLVDEAHLIPQNSNTMYRRFLDGLRQYNPHLKVIGLTATPYRLGHGMLTEGKNRMFTDIAYEANVADLIKEGFLCPLISKAGLARADTKGLHVRGGEFIASEVAALMDKEELIRGAVEEMLAYGQERKAWLIFCAGVDHARNVATCLNAHGITAAMVCGDTPTAERDRILADFKARKIRAVTNADILTTGFDDPGIDLLAMLRPTESTGLYVQIMGRGLRIMYEPGYDIETTEGRLAAIANGPKPNCLVLDFAGNVTRHGPIDQIKVKKPNEGAGGGVAPAKECPDCHMLLHTSVMLCPGCGHEWQYAPSHEATASDAPIIASIEPPREHQVLNVYYSEHRKGRQTLAMTVKGDTMGLASNGDKPPSLRVEYITESGAFNEWVPVEDPRSNVRKHATTWFWRRGLMPIDTVQKTLEEAYKGNIPAPKSIVVQPDGKYWRVTGAKF